MVQLKSPVLMAFAIGSAMAMAIPKPVDGSAVAVRDAEPETYSGTFINRYDEISEKDKREAEAEAEPESKATYSGTFINRYDEVAE
ncbi:hypothetical protein JMJ35_007236 [Cladonia borealis]|uniref:Uncharacterized protein n=1 Tax=Cladonia borealis TaxID=184061 RepID=A0AA39QV64_9LECA|nr:hypothetical protein JMJ35_007236 [Cladonia borealis]